MTWLRRIAAELVGLFVDDGALAALAVVWVASCWLGLALLRFGPMATAALLFLGLAAALGFSVVRS